MPGVLRSNGRYWLEDNRVDLCATVYGSQGYGSSKDTLWSGGYDMDGMRFFEG